MFEKPELVECVPGYIHREREVKGGEGCHSPGTICPSCHADLKFYEVSVPGIITGKDRVRMARRKEREYEESLKQKSK